MPTATASPTPTWTWVNAGKVTAPILLYHHVADGEPTNRYTVSTSEFKKQMQILRELGYTTVPVSLIAEAINYGAALPAKPIVITFDDGGKDVYTTAFPIMRDFGFTGTMYLVAGYFGADKVVTIEEARELSNAGWEIGSHSMTHADLVKDGNWKQEIYDSRISLEESLGIPVTTFAYPFGIADSNVIQRTMRWGYQSAVGLGTFFEHDPYSVYYLSRLEVQSTYDLDAFLNLLPWKE